MQRITLGRTDQNWSVFTSGDFGLTAAEQNEIVSIRKRYDNE